ncbi:hypothetical protein GCM10010149_88170 [Nonomuraea roseoviolacea subsp. roseoviolacea]|uniref:hypothetical protein n=1 Tax=Nonomuraea roseoviolacea TaxID=103837 RepID=UPI0031DE9D77
MLKDITGREVLAVRMERNDAGAATIKDYLIALLIDLWKSSEDADPAKPFGNPSWEFDLYEALVRAGLISGLIEDGDYVSEVDREAGNRLINLAIKTLGEN